MADYRFSAQVISRGKGQSSIASAAYRAASRLTDERIGQTFNYTRKAGVIHSEILAPDNAPDWMCDREQLWNAVEAVEKRKNSQLAREVQLSLPHELDPAQRLELVRGFVQERFVNHGMIADIAIHAPGKEGDQRNHHAHVMLTMRELTADGFHSSKATPKARAWNDPELLKEWREDWARHQNRALERAGSSDRVDHRSYEDQGIDREPTKHLGPDASEMERRGEPSRIGDENREIESRNSDRAKTYVQDIVVSAELEKARGKFAAWSAYSRLELEHAQELQNLDLAQKQDRLKSALEGQLQEQYGAHRAAIGEQINSLDRRLSSKGLRKVFRDVFGQSERDRAERDNLKKALASIEDRERQQRAGLRRYLSEQRKTLAKDQARQKKRTEARIRSRAAWLDKQAQKHTQEPQQPSKGKWWQKPTPQPSGAPEGQNRPANNNRPGKDIKKPGDRDLRDIWNRGRDDPGREPD